MGPEAAGIKPAAPAGPKAVPAQPGRIQPALDMLPDWEDRERMRRFVREEGLSFFQAMPGSPEQKAVLAFLPQAKNDEAGHFIVCAKSAVGGISGAMDGFILEEGNVVFIAHAKVTGERRYERHLMLYCAALALAKPKYIVYAAQRSQLTMEVSGRLIFLGRGLGMSAIPSSHPSMIFMRRPGREHDPVASGEEISKLLRALKPVMDGQLDAAIEDFAKKGVLALVPLPISPDTREHLHELRDAVLALALPTAQLEAMLESLKMEYVLKRNDITPSAL